MSDRKRRYIFLTGGVSSSSGKGITCASIGTLLETYGYKISFRKLDGYLNVNAGTMNPQEHGEVYVLNDGTETDLDLGHYNRFTDAVLNENSSVSMGSVYKEVIDKDETGFYDGACVQTVPHVVDAIKDRILNGHDDDVDFVIVEIGGTVGDIENASMIEAINQIGASFDREERAVCFMHLVVIPYMRAADEYKTKPAQNSCKELRSMGIHPDVLLCRVENNITKEQRAKISGKMATHCAVREDNVIFMDDVESVYQIPAVHWEDIPEAVLGHFRLPHNDGIERSTDWIDKVSRLNIKVGRKVKVGIFGKYTNVRDSYKSIAESLQHASVMLGIDTEVEYYNEASEIMCDGVLIPGGFGGRGIEEKEQAFLYAYYNSLPCLGLCLGLQTSIVAFAKEICKIKDASYEEFKEDRPGTYLIHMMEEQKKVSSRSGTMRLGQCKSIISDKESMFCKAYLRWGNQVNQVKQDPSGDLYILERHRHRYEVNPDHVETLAENGMNVVAVSESGLVEAVELQSKSGVDKTWFIGTQFHPEYKSKFMYPHPLFVAFLHKIGE